MIDLNKENLTSIIMLISMPVLTYFGFSEAVKSQIVGVLVALIILLGQIYNEKHNSTLISGSDDDGA